MKESSRKILMVTIVSPLILFVYAILQPVFYYSGIKKYMTGCRHNLGVDIFNRFTVRPVGPDGDKVIITENKYDWQDEPLKAQTNLCCPLRKEYVNGCENKIHVDYGIFPFDKMKEQQEFKSTIIIACDKFGNHPEGDYYTINAQRRTSTYSDIPQKQYKKWYAAFVAGDLSAAELGPVKWNEIEKSGKEER